ncbi:YihY/virulence factor BrkB family protein [Ramlibacter sp. AW1]|uniref:YihY/virulence factor BrkB family protein n=1 Tax=Ramlibacter aurantiacus TaxID=2801330 RepID=A0A936ZFP5_9BURK|nr:YihY/virulence factor BrkB family protein [Ramlibacter aurantiacus]MBL0420072.1 YihY/virulence factor BrkB family protein [Ramlibacter aurantiacus]
MKIRGIPPMQFLRELYAKISEDNVYNGAAALGFYLTLAIFPAMILLMGLIPFLPIPRVDTAIMDLMRQTLPADAASMFTKVLEEVMKKESGGIVSVGALGTLWAASTGMYAIMQQLNITYDVKEARSFIRARLVAIGLSLLFGALMITAFSLIVMGGIAQDWLGERFGFSDALLTFFASLRWVIIVLAILLAFSLTYYLAPNVRGQRFVFITPGGVVATILLLIASVGFAIYAQNFADYSAVYGGIGAVVALMMWLYIAGLVMLVGSEVNVLVEHHSPKGKQIGERAPGQPAAEKPHRQSESPVRS